MVIPHNKQFLLTKAVVDDPFFDDWNRYTIQEYQLLAHPNLSVARTEYSENQFIVLGNVYDYRNPEFSNHQFAELISYCNTQDDILKEYSETNGENVLIICNSQGIFLVNDACSQMEVFYNEDCSVIGSQPKLFERILKLNGRTNPDAKTHFQSEVFKRKKTNIGIETEFEGINHLIGNHYLDLDAKKQVRFYPNQQLKKISVKESAELTRKILTGYLKSAAYRGTIALPVTAGIDSRVILTCALDAKIQNLEFFTIKFPWMDENHNDLVISKRIAEELDFKLDIYDISNKDNPDVPAFDQSLSLHNKLFDASTIYVLKQFGDRNVTVVDGSIIGVTKNFFGKLLNVSGSNLARMSGYPDSIFAINQFNRWLSESKTLFKKNGYHPLDMFFWEDRASNWMLTVKSKFLMVSNYYSIFNSRVLFESMLRTKRKYRDAQNHKIFNSILSNTENDLSHIPINPSLKKKIMVLGKQLGLYYVYRNIMIKLGWLKFN